jgi:hypothetical protein
MILEFFFDWPAIPGPEFIESLMARAGEGSPL